MACSVTYPILCGGAMSLAYLNGKLVPATQAVVPVYDAGFVLGTTVAEQLRTFGGRLFRLEPHLARLQHSLDVVGVDLGPSMAELGEAAEDLAAKNHALGDPGDDLGLSIFVTPGPYSTMAAMVGADAHRGPLVCMHTYPLPFSLWADKYRTGQSLVVTDIQQVPPSCWPVELKCRSRMHYYLADLQARRIEPGARALLLDADGYVLEASSANLCIFRREEGLVSPPQEKILPGVSIAVIAELGRSLEIPFSHRDLTVDQLLQADEVLLCSTSPCVWPVLRLNGQTIGRGTPGETLQRLLTAWSELAGLNIQSQAERFAQRSTDW
jgi:branched-subunit amino acid aminotransferase/4-amino-4-deoxychorismate lyase